MIAADEGPSVMRPRWDFHSEPVDWILEDRCLPVIPNLGVIALTTGGFVLMIPFPGAMSTLAGSSASFGPNLAAGVSGTPFNIPFFVLGSGGISSALPGNITGYPALASGGPGASSTGINPMIYVGSGSNEALGPPIPLVTRNTIANDRLNPLPLIGGATASTSSLLPPAPSAAVSSAPAPAPAPSSSPMSASGTSGGPTMPPPGSSLRGGFVRFPSLFPGLPATSSTGAAAGGFGPVVLPPGGTGGPGGRGVGGP